MHFGDDEIFFGNLKYNFVELGARRHKLSLDKGNLILAGGQIGLKENVVGSARM